MSLAQTMKDLETANKALEGQVAAIKAETDKAAAAAADALAKVTAQLAEKDVAIKGLTDQIAVAAQAADEAIKVRTGLEAKVAQLTGDLDKAKATLANPAFKDAAASGQAKAPKDPGEASGKQPDAEFEAAYRAETNPEKRAQMWRDRVR